MLLSTPQILSIVILPWLEYSLSKEIDNTDHCAHRKQDALLQVAAALARKLPVTFQNCASKHLLALLTQAAVENSSAFGRIAALELLSLYGHASTEIMNAIKIGLFDVGCVAESVLSCTKKFRYLTDDFLCSLTKELYHPCSSICLAAAKILSSVYLEPCTSASQRNIILNALAQALHHPSNKEKPVFTMINTATNISVNNSSQTMICCIGYLDQTLFHELSHVCGYS